jgi:hypothetical protein
MPYASSAAYTTQRSSSPNVSGAILYGNAHVELRVAVATNVASDRAACMVATQRISIEQFATTSRDGAWELIDGELVAETPSSDWSGWIAGEVFARLSL